MRIKIIGDNNCARATRHLLRMAGFAVTEFLPAEAITQGPHSGYAITIEVSPAVVATRSPDLAPATYPSPAPMPGYTTHGQPAPPTEEAPAADPSAADASSLSSTSSHIHFDSVDSALEAAILRHVTQLAAVPVVVDRPGGVVHSERELRIVIPRTGVLKADEAAAVAVEFGVLRGLLDLTSPRPPVKTDKSTHSAGSFRNASGKKWWKVFSIAMLAGMFLVAARAQAGPAYFWFSPLSHSLELTRAVDPHGMRAAFAADPKVTNGAYLRLAASIAPVPPQGEFSVGQQTKITDGTNTLVIDPCKGQSKVYVSINQTANTQLAAGTSSKKIYICSIHVVVATATNVALVEGTGSVCATGTAGVSGFGGATAATGWNFAANGGIALGNGDAAVGAEGTSADNLCLYMSGSGQVSGGLSYVVQ